MKKFPIVVFLLIAIPFVSYSQTDLRLSLKMNPTVTYNRYTSKTDTITVENLRDDVRLTFGLAADLGLTESYFFSTGLLYSLRKVSFVALDQISGETEDEQYQLEYIEIPVTLKLYTNDLGVDSKIYFQTGFTLDFLVNWNGININDDLVQDFSFFDSSFYFGAGYDKQLGVSTAFFVGLFYQRGLVNITKNSPIVTLKNDILGLDLGLRF